MHTITKKKTGKHFVAIFGGAVAGSEAASQLASRGIAVAVFEQSLLPYGKIEDGLPKWHHKLRDQEEQKIDGKIDHPNIWYVPKIQLGTDISFQELRQWGFSAIILATGAWRDRPLPIKGLDDFIDHGIHYQNPFVYWFNHKHEPDFNGPPYKILDDAIVIGGGLASLDVVKILMIETVVAALSQHGIKSDLFTLEKKGIGPTLESLNLTLDDLNLKGCTLYYRRRAIDMPLTPMPTDTPEKLEKARNIRQKILDNFQRKYLFKFVPNSTPVDKIIQDGKLTGLRFQKTRIEGDRVSPVEDEYFDVKTPMVISSIGSIPEKIEGLPWEEQVFKITDPKTCLIEGYDNVFAIGNAVTGKGNINESVKHSREISTGIIDNFFEWQQDEYQNWHRQTVTKVDRDINQIIGKIENQQSLPDQMYNEILEKVNTMQLKAGYDGNYPSWIEKHLPLRLENM
jgi:NADPH-dependent glutamate synthase beta subunit-like oxidoreductase